MFYTMHQVNYQSTAREYYDHGSTQARSPRNLSTDMGYCLCSVSPLSSFHWFVSTSVLLLVLPKSVFLQVHLDIP